MAPLRTTAHRAALSAFRRLPVPLRRTVVRLLTPRYSVGAVVVVRRGGRVLMLRQRHHYGWTLPGGLLGRGETPREALARELAEELRLSLPLPDWPLVTTVDPTTRHVDVIFVVDLPPGVEPGTTVDGLEVVRAAWRDPAGPGVMEPTAALLRQVGAAEAARRTPAPKTAP